MTKKTRWTLEVEFRWMILRAIAWSLVIILAGVITDVVTGSAVNQVEGYNQAVYAQLPETAYVAYRQ